MRLSPQFSVRARSSASTAFHRLSGWGTGSLYGPDANFGSVEPADVRTVYTDFTPEYFTDEFQAQAHLDQHFR